MNDQNKFETMMEKLEAERDELRVKLNLAKMEAKDEWEALEKKMDGLRGRMKVVSEEAREAGGDVGAALDVVADEVKQGFARLRKML
jgi:dsDNA-specific endonuclease/ATPase MutS2